MEIKVCDTCDDRSFVLDKNNMCFICSWNNYVEEASSAGVSYATFKEYFKQFYRLEYELA